MKRSLLLSLFSAILLIFGAFALDMTFDDGPYIFPKGKRLLVQWFEGGKLKRKMINQKNHEKFDQFDKSIFDPSYLFTDYKDETLGQFHFDGIKKIAAISDIHGQFDLWMKIMQSNGIVDQNNDWIYGDGHFVIVGDIFDRGPDVQDCLWFVYKLEQQAAAAGGKVHYLWGNHEQMVLDGDLRYIHQKYKAVEQSLQMDYRQIFGPESTLGAWLRTKPITISINNIQFVHGGFSPALAASGFTVKEINDSFRETIMDATAEDSIYKDRRIHFLDGPMGPLWYRGYFRDTLLTNTRIDDILKHLDKQHIVVGHTSQLKVEKRFDGRIFVVDSSIKLGKYGEILLIENGEFFSGDPAGNRIKLL